MKPITVNILLMEFELIITRWVGVSAFFCGMVAAHRHLNK